MVKAGDDKLPPNPLPLPPLPPRLFVVKAGDDKLPPNPLPLPPLPPRLFVVKTGDGSNLHLHSWSDSVLWKGPGNGGQEHLNDHSYPKLYFMVWPIVTPDQREFFKELLDDEFQFKKAEVRGPVGVANGMIDGYSEGDCESRNIVEIAFTDNFTNP